MEKFKNNKKNVFYLYEAFDNENIQTIGEIFNCLDGNFDNYTVLKYASKIAEGILSEVNWNRRQLRNIIICVIPEDNNQWNSFLLEIGKMVVEYTGMTNASRILSKDEYGHIRLKENINVQNRKVILLDGILLSYKDSLDCCVELLLNGAINVRTISIVSSSDNSNEKDDSEYDEYDEIDEEDDGEYDEYDEIDEEDDGEYDEYDKIDEEDDSEYDELDEIDENDCEDTELSENYLKFERFCRAVEKLSPNSIEIVEHYRYIKRPKYSEINDLIYKSQNGDKKALDLIVKYYFRYICNLSAYYFHNYGIAMEEAMFYAIDELIEQVKSFDLSKHFDFNKYIGLRISNSIRRKSQIDVIGMYYPIHLKEEIWKFKKLLIDECYIESPQIIEERVKSYKYYLSYMNDEYYGFDDTEGFEGFEYYNDYLDYYYNKDEEKTIDIKEINRGKYSDEAYLREDFYCCTPEIIINDEDIIRIYNNMLPTIIIYDLNENEFSYEIEDEIEKDLLKKDLNDIILTLSPRQAKVIELRFGLKDGWAKTLEEIAEEFQITRERVRQIETKALKRLRHLRRSTKLKDYLL